MITHRSVQITLLLSFALLFGGLNAGCKGGRFGNTISKSQEISLGQQASQEVEQRYKVIRTGANAEKLQRVADRIFPLAQKDWDVPYTVELIDSKEVNAFALPGGPIYFYRGLVELTESDDELASVLGHEATHVVRRHSVKQISDANTKGLILAVLTGGSSDLIQTLANIGLTLDQLKYSRGDESEADERGFAYMTDAGYNPEAMASFFRKLDKEDRKQKGLREPEWLRSHPVTRTRVERAEERAKLYKQQHGEGSK